MSINIGPPSVEELRPRITVIGVGGAGGNAIANMIRAEIDGVDFIVANTDAQALNNASAEHRIQLGADITQGLGAGSRPEVGRAAAEETVAEIERALDGVNMVFIAAGMGGGTGTGAAPVIAEVARSRGILTVGVVTKPFMFEGTRRMRSAEAGIEELQKHVDTLIVIPNQNLFLVAKADTTFKEAFQLADEVLQQGVRSITDLIVNPGMINLDFADIRSVMNEMGKAMMGTGEGEGPNRALEAAERAIANPLLDGVSMQGAKGVIISIIGGDDMKLLEVDEAANHIRELVDPEANIIWGSAFNPDLQGKIRVSVVATGIEQGGSSIAGAGVARPLDLRSSSRSPRPFDVAAPAGAGSAAGPGGLAGSGRNEALDPLDSPGARDFSAPASALPSGSGAVPAFGGVAPAAAGHELPLDPAAAFPADSGADPAADAKSDAGQEGPGQQGMRQFAPPPLQGAPGVAGGAAQPAEDRATDELLLDASRLVQADEQVQPLSRRRGLLGAGLDDEAEPQPRLPVDPANKTRAAGGGTLFERMAGFSRGGAPADPSRLSDSGSGDDHGGDGSGFPIPRFLNRQNNQ